MHTLPAITGSKNHAEKVMQAILFLQKNHPKEFAFISGKIRKITIIDDAKRSDNEVNPVTRNYTMHSGLLYGYPQVREHIASLLIHESHHISQHRKGVKNIDSRAERSAYARQLAFLTKIKSKDLCRHVKNDFDSKYVKNSNKRPL